MDSTQLGTLRSKLSKEIQELEEKLKERRDKIRAIDLVRGMLTEESIGQPGNKAPDVDGKRFLKMGLQEAILTCIDEPMPHLWTVPEIKKELLTGGLKSKAKDLYSSISATLQRLESKGMVHSEKREKGGKRYKIKEKEATSPNPSPSGNN
jgi:DNA-binding transcriptional ArsR family regulator